ncbi:MAG: hydrogen gas-evolving membrane-bound hydrogenase subunit E, partial [Gammaproteobacteria bacterium]
AQVPFHFWLPNAMAAPTPVSAFLHSATMVKAGVYLMARLNPGLGGTELWLYSLGIFGALTMFTGSFMALRSTNAKQMLAYTTIMALGTLTMLIGIGTEAAIIAAMVFLLAHALYKAALFMLAGVLDHETGTKDITQMGGLRKSMPVAFVTACIAALSLAGLPPLFGFVAKELMFKATLAAPMLTWFTTVLAWLSAVMIVAMAMVFALRPFTGSLQSTPKTPHEAPPALLIGPIVLAGLSLVFGMLGTVPATMLIDSAVFAVYGEQLTIDLALWHGINTPLLLSVAAVGVGALLFWQWPQILSVYQRLTFIDRFGPERGYEQLLTGLHGFAKWQTGVLQNGYMRNYLITILLTTVALIGWTYFGYTGSSWPAFSVDIRFYEAVVAALIVAGAIAASVTHSRLGAVATVGMVGFGVAIMYLFFSAPDVGMTQIMVETLTVILLVLVLFKLPSFLALSSPAARVRDAIVAIAFGGMMTLLLLAVNDVTVVDKISDQLVAWSYTQAYGRNIVNVILVDFRALDTLGEIFVVGTAAVGVYAMIRLRAEDNVGDNKQ